MSPQVAALAGVAGRQLGLWPISGCRWQLRLRRPRARAATMGRKPHQHVVFKEPPRPAKKRRTDGDGGDDPSKKYWFSTRDIAKFAANGSDARTKKKYELYELRKAGALPSKTLKTPMPILRGMRQKHGERQKRKREEEEEAGTFNKRRHEQQEQAFARMDPLARAGQGWDQLRQLKMERGSRAERSGGDVDGDRGLRTSAGKFQGGVLYVNQDNPLGVKPKAPRMVKAKDMHKPEVRCPHPAPDPPAKRFPVDTARVGSAQGKAFKGKFDKKFVKKK
eukprot:COSAG04_NODE_4170_length_2257_cov_5.743744_1_plen_278_part_00